MRNKLCTAIITHSTAGKSEAAIVPRYQCEHDPRDLEGLRGAGEADDRVFRKVKVRSTCSNDSNLSMSSKANISKKWCLFVTQTLPFHFCSYCPCTTLSRSPTGALLTDCGNPTSSSPSPCPLLSCALITTEHQKSQPCNQAKN